MAGADEIIEDYASSLEWLNTNDRYAINNFTVIAKENTEHADAISTVLIDHIAKAHPNHKLPALYVLDSIAKNVGTPYTLFLGHRLYTTFMGAYSLVDGNVRKKLDEMLKTWKQPVPGSLDSRPVFDSSITKRIENALIQAKTRTLEVEQRQQREQQDLLRRRTPNSLATSQWRNTATPPQHGSPFPIPSSQGVVRYPDSATPIPHQNNTPHQQNRNFAPPPPTNQYPSASAQSGNFQRQWAPGPDLGLLERNIQELIDKFQSLVTYGIDDPGMPIKLKALRDLQMILKTQDLPPEQLQAVRSQVDTLQALPMPPVPQPNGTLPPMPTPSHAAQPSAVGQPPYQSPYQMPFQHMPSLPIAPPSADVRTHTPSQAPALPTSDFLTKLLSSRTSTPNERPYDASHAQAATSDGPPPAPEAGAENSLIAQLRKSGLLGPMATPSAVFSPSINQGSGPAPVTNISSSLATLSSLLRPPLAEKSSNIEMTSASLKIPRTHLIEKLYRDQSNQCLSCGKRFLNNDEGKSKKARHMDWHFRTNQKLADATQRGQSRSWYVDEMDWITYKEGDDGEEKNGGQGLIETGSSATVSKNDPKNKYISVPSDNDMPCGICQEKFVPSWNEQLQDFVWMDAVRIGDKVYHASCYADFKKDEGPARTATSDSVLGKRKAEASSDNVLPAKRIMSES